MAYILCLIDVELPVTHLLFGLSGHLQEVTCLKLFLLLTLFLPLLSGFIPAICKGTHVDFTTVLNSRGT
jgi:hypothetical protein